MADKWGQQPGEPGVPFEYFAYYRDLGPSRNYPKVAAQFGISVNTVNRHAHSYRWRERVRAWDAEMDRQARERLLFERGKLAERHFDVASRLLDKVEERLETLDAEGLTPRDLIQMFVESVKVGRLSTDQATTISESRDNEASEANQTLLDILRDPALAQMAATIGESLVSERPVTPDTSPAGTHLHLVQPTEPSGEAE